MLNVLSMKNSPKSLKEHVLIGFLKLRAVLKQLDPHPNPANQMNTDPRGSGYAILTLRLIILKLKEKYAGKVQPEKNLN
jgi:hypothetical protein